MPGIPIKEARHTWDGGPVVLNDRRPLDPATRRYRYWCDEIDLRGMGEAVLPANRVVGGTGAISIPGSRGPKTVIYKGRVQGLDEDALREGSDVLEAGFWNVTAERRMDIAYHEDRGVTPAYFFLARGTVNVVDAPKKGGVPTEWQASFVVSIQLTDPRIYDAVEVAHSETWVLEVSGVEARAFPHPEGVVFHHPDGVPFPEPFSPVAPTSGSIDVTYAGDRRVPTPISFDVFGPVNHLIATDAERDVTLDIDYNLPEGRSYTVNLREGTIMLNRAYRDVVLADSPVLYWRLGEESGVVAADSSPQGRTGTHAGGVTLGATGMIVGDTNKAVDLDGVDDRIISTYNPFADSSTRTFEGWAHRDSATGVQTLIGGSAATGPALVIAANGDVRFHPDASGAAVTWATAAPGAAVTFHWVLIFNESTGTAELFIDGVSKGTRAAGAYHAAPGNFMAGAHVATTEPFNGRLDEIAVYEHALTAARILAHHEAGTVVEGVTDLRPYLVWPESTWWANVNRDLPPGVRVIDLSAISFQEPARVDLRYNPASP